MKEDLLGKTERSRFVTEEVTTPEKSCNYIGLFRLSNGREIHFTTLFPTTEGNGNPLPVF